jgi:hypothetical protein
MTPRTKVSISPGSPRAPKNFRKAAPGMSRQAVAFVGCSLNVQRPFFQIRNPRD